MTLSTQAAILEQINQPLTIKTLDLAPPQQGEVLVRVAAAGVCHSDWHLATGDTKHPLPVVLGHEGAGTIEAVGEGVTSYNIGDHVSLNWAPYCGDCFYCGKGTPALCSTFVEPLWAGTMMEGTTRFSRDGEPVYQYSGLGCFAQRTVVPASCCVKMPQEVPFEVAALIGCAVTTGVGAVLNTVNIAQGDSIAVFGCGGVGLSMILGAKRTGAETIIAVDRDETKCELAKSLGATHALVAGENTTKEIAALTNGRGADFAFEAVGLSAVQENCFHAIRPGGTVVLAGLSPMGSETVFSGAEITRQEKRIVGSYYGSCDVLRDFPLYAKWFLEGKLPIDKLISKHYPLSEINEAFEAMLSGKTARGVIIFDE